MSEPAFRDSIEDEELDLGEVYEYLQGKDAQADDNKPADPETEKMIEEIVELTIAEEVERFPWRKPELAFGIDHQYSTSKILDMDFADGNPSIIARIARQAAHSIQIPENTAYLHGLGVFSSACVVNFAVEYYSKTIPVGLYTICAQPSGSGKSGVNGIFVEPINKALVKRNIELAMLHKNIDAELESLDKKGEAAKSDPGLLREYARATHDLMTQKNRRPMVFEAKKDATPEGAEVAAAKQGGVFNIVADEEEGLSTYLGLAYSDGKRPPNFGMVNAVFGGDMMATARVGRVGANCHVRGALAVISQYSSVDLMIKAGATGRGVSERCLILKEPSLMGWRQHSRERQGVDKDLMAEYSALCDNVLGGSYPIELTLSEQCKDMIVDLKNINEEKIRPGNEYGDSQVKGFVSKIEQHVLKMAAVIHVSDQWNPLYVSRPATEIQEGTLVKAMKICMDLTESYKTLIESATATGASKLVLEVLAIMKRYAMNSKKSFTVDKLRMAVKKEAWFLGIEGNKLDYLVNLMRRCEGMNFCHVKEEGKDKKKWYVLINPALKEFVIKGDE